MHAGVRYPARLLPQVVETLKSQQEAAASAAQAAAQAGPSSHGQGGCQVRLSRLVAVLMATA